MNAVAGGVPIEVLLVEDSADDAALTRRALDQGKVRNRVHHVASRPSRGSGAKAGSPTRHRPT